MSKETVILLDYLLSLFVVFAHIQQAPSLLTMKTRHALTGYLFSLEVVTKMPLDLPTNFSSD